MRRLAQFSAIAILACTSFALSSCREPSQPLGSEPEDTGSVRQGLKEGNPLLGKRVSAFVTVDPEGNTVDLNKHLGKDVILLDFWATWCGPCLMAMPEVEQVAEEFKDRGLVSYAVNVGEDPDTVKEFLEQYKLDIPVAMDFDGNIQDAFKSDGLPYTIVIGKDGRMQVAHRGYRRGFGKQLSAEVAALLDGEVLAGE